jgi:hypothetical protein
MAVPWIWKVSLVVLVACLIASMVIGTVKLATTPDYVFRPAEQGWRGLEFPR